MDSGDAGEDASRRETLRAADSSYELAGPLTNQPYKAGVQPPLSQGLPLLPARATILNVATEPQQASTLRVACASFAAHWKGSSILQTPLAGLVISIAREVRYNHRPPLHQPIRLPSTFTDRAQISSTAVRGDTADTPASTTAHPHAVFRPLSDGDQEFNHSSER